MKAIGNYLIIQESKEAITKTSGGLELTEKLKDDIRYRKGIIISSGPDILKKDQTAHRKLDPTNHAFVDVFVGGVGLQIWEAVGTMLAPEAVRNPVPFSGCVFAVFGLLPA